MSSSDNHTNNPVGNPASRILGRLKRSWGRVSPQKQLLWLGLISISAVVTFTAWIWVNRTQAVIDRSVSKFGMALAQALARGGAEALSNNGNLEGLKYYILTEREETPAIAYVVFCNKDGKVLLDSQMLPNSKSKDNKEVFHIYEDNVNHKVPGVYASPPDIARSQISLFR